MTRGTARLLAATGLAFGGVLVAAPAQADDYETYMTYGECDQARRAYAQMGATIVRPCFPVRISGGYETYYRFVYRF